MKYITLFIPGEEGIYLVSSKLQYWIGELTHNDKQVLRDLILDLAYFCSFEVITYAILPLEFKILIRNSAPLILSNV